MIYLSSLILIYINIFTTFLKGRGDIWRKITLFFMWLLFWGNITNADYDNYIRLYNHVANYGEGFSTSDIGLVYLMRIGNILNLNYNIFLLVVSFLGLLLITKTIYKYSLKPQYVISLYFVYPFLLDVVQVSHFLAMSLVIYGIGILVNTEKNNSLIFIFIILLASSLHIISIIFLPVLMFYRSSVHKLYRYITIILMLSIPIAYTSLPYRVISMFFSTIRVEQYFNNRPNFGFLIQFLIQGLILLFIWYARKITNQNKIYSTFADVVFKVNVYLLLLYPLYMINGTFERGFRMVIILNQMVLTNAIYHLKNIRLKIIMTSILFMFNFLLFLYYIYFPFQETVFFPIFENNLLW